MKAFVLIECRTAAGLLLFGLVLVQQRRLLLVTGLHVASRPSAMKESAEALTCGLLLPRVPNFSRSALSVRSCFRYVTHAAWARSAEAVVVVLRRVASSAVRG